MFFKTFRGLKFRFQQNQDTLNSEASWAGDNVQIPPDQTFHWLKTAHTASINLTVEQRLESLYLLSWRDLYSELLYWISL